MLRLSLPERFPIQYVAIFAGILFLVQQLEGTSLAFSVYAFLFVIVGGFAVNEGGGLTRPSGAYIFFYVTLGVLVGLCWKAILGEPADTHLARPQLTMLIYVGGACGLYVSAAISRRFSRKRAFLEGIVNDTNLQNATIGCLVIGTALTIATRVLTKQAGGILSALYQLNHFNELALLLGVTYVIHRTGGRRSLNIPVLLAGSIEFIVGGVLGFSKEAMFTPFACWLVAAASQNYRITRAQVITVALLFFFLFYYMVPYSQYGRSLMVPTLSDNVQVAGNLLSDLTAVRQHAQHGDNWNDQPAVATYFDKPEGFFDRLQMITVDDGLNDLTERRGPYGLYPILEDFENLIPHFIWPDKPSVLWGNVYLHEEGGGLAEEDVTTGISFTPTGEAFHLAGWAGVLVLAPAIWTMAFLLFDSLCGDARRTPWGLLTVVLFAHIAPEGLLAGLIYELGYGAFSIVVAALLSAYVMPHLGGLLVGPGGRIADGRLPVRGVPRRIASLPSPGSTES